MERTDGMRTRQHKRAVVLATAAITAILATGLRADAQPSARPITAANFEQAAPRGFGDRNNSWAQAMVWWRNHLYVGTGRQALCSSLYSVWQFIALTVSREFADTWFPYPPAHPDLSCAADGLDLELQAEIWRLTPGPGTWERVYQSPLELAHPGAGDLFPPVPGRKVPYDITFRGFSVHTDPDGTEALYAFGVNSTVMWDRTKLPPPRILRTTDGVNWQPVPQTPGTFLGDMPYNDDHSSFRSPVSFDGKLFVLSGPIFGQGSLIGSADPAKGDDAWFLAAPTEMVFYELAVFNGWLYAGTFNPVGGYSVVKTRAEGPPPYQFVTVVPAGAYLPTRPSKSVVSMHEYHGRLHVGTATQTELIRINPDDTWDLVVGPPRAVPLPDGGVEWKYPVSGLDAGFGHTLNDHAWQMDDPYRFLYVGTYNASITWKHDPVYGPLLAHNMGAHLYRTQEGWYFSPITTNGFATFSDPLGGPFDYGIRTMATTPHGAFFGTVNDYYGLMIFQANTRGSNAPDPVDRVEIEPTTNGSALLSWPVSPRAVTYEIWRAEIHDVLIRDELNFEAWSGETGNKIPDTYIGPYVLIGVTGDLFYIDATVEDGKRYMYYVVVKTKQGLGSDPSNLVTFPLLTPPVTFASLLREVDRIDQRGRVRDPLVRMTKVRTKIAMAQSAAAGCSIRDAIQLLKPRPAANDVLQPEATDLEVLMSKLERRLTLFTRLPQHLSSDEFCVVQFVFGERVGSRGEP
jgi:hypothetical protein